jgi:apolipoprotein N-acyltransferase
MPFAAWLSIFSIAALAFVIAVLLFRALVLRGALWTGLLAFPATWVSLEHVRNLTSVHGTAGSLAYSQLRFLPFLQLASITGPWGMTFLLLLFPAGISIGLHLRSTDPKRGLRIVAATAASIVVVLVFGTVRLAMPPSGQQVKAGLITSDEATNDEVAGSGTDTERLFRSYAGEAEQLANRGAQVIVLPEKLGVVLDSDSKNSDSIFQSLADRTGSTFVVGQVYVVPPHKYNQARIYQPMSSALFYNKQHLLPPMESNLTPGTGLVTLSRTNQKWGVAICKDMDFTPLSRQCGKAGLGLMLVPGWDFNVDRSWHGHMAVMRGVEDGFSIVRTAKNGYLTVSDSRGRILAETRSDSAPFPTLVASVPAAHSATIYLLLGDWFPWLAMGTMVFSMFRVFRLRQ